MDNTLLFNDDWENIISRIPDKSIDLLLTDPPYLHVKGGMKSKGLNRGVRSAENKVVEEMSDFGEVEINKFLDAVKPKLKVFNSYIFCSKLQIPYYLNWALKNKCQFDVLMWDKCHLGIISRKFFSTNYEYIIRIYNIGLNAIEDSSYYQKVIREPRPNNKLHVSQKPEIILEKFVLLSSKENDVVFDPFMGSGTTGVVCKKLKRLFIGIEKDKKYYDIALNRISEI